MLVAVVVVGVVAMLVVVMVVAMIMRGMIVVVVTMIMVMMVVIVMPVIVMPVIIVTMRVAAVGVSAALGIERRLDLDDARTEAFYHGLDDMVAADAQALGHDLRRQMAIAEVPADANEVVRIAAADLQQRLGRRDHFDQPAVLQHQRVTAAQRDGILQVEQEFEAPRPRHRHAAAVPVVEIEHHRIRRRLREAVLSLNLPGA